MVRSRAVPGDILPAQGGAPALSCCTLASGPGTWGLPLGSVWLPVALLKSCVLGRVQVQHLSLGLCILRCFCWLPTSDLAPGSSHAVGTGVILLMDRTGLELPERRGWCLLGVGDTAALPLGSRPVHGRGGTAVYSSTLPPSQHHPHRPQLPQGLEHSPCCFQYALQGCLQWAGRVISASQTG